MSGAQIITLPTPQYNRDEAFKRIEGMCLEILRHEGDRGFEREAFAAMASAAQIVISKRSTDEYTLAGACDNFLRFVKHAILRPSDRNYLDGKLRLGVMLYDPRLELREKEEAGA